MTLNTFWKSLTERRLQPAAGRLVHMMAIAKTDALFGLYQTTRAAACVAQNSLPPPDPDYGKFSIVSYDLPGQSFITCQECLTIMLSTDKPMYRV